VTIIHGSSLLRFHLMKDPIKAHIVRWFIFYNFFNFFSSFFKIKRVIKRLILRFPPEFS